MFEYRSQEQTSFAKLIGDSLDPGLPLLAGAAAGVGKTHGYAIPLVTSGLKVAIAFPTRALIHQFINSDGFAAARSLRPSVTFAELLPKSAYESKETHQAAKEAALKADVLLVTHAAALIDGRYPQYAQLRERDVVLFDEADQLADAADLRSTFTLPAGGTDINAILTQAASSPDLEQRFAASSIKYAIEHPAWYKVVGFNSDGELTLKHRVPGRMLKPLLRDAKRCIFVSGTLQVSGSFKHFTRAIGLTDVDPASRHIDPRHHGELEAYVAQEPMDDRQMAEVIAQSKRPTLVLTTSYSQAELLGSMVNGSIVRRRGEAVSHAINRCGNNSILMAPGIWTGLDNPDRRWGTIIIPKAPYGVPAVIDGQYITHYADSATSAQRRINQGLHRGLRTQDAYCKLLMLDPRCSKKELIAGVPKRFEVGVL